MSNRAIISTGDAPQAIGPYSQAVKVNGTVYLSGQIPLDPATMQMVEGDIRAQAERVFGNLRAVASAAGGDLNQCVKINIYLTDLGASPRATLALLHACKALALLRGRDYALPDDIRQLAPLVLAHRILMTPDAELEGGTGAAVVTEALAKVGYKTPRR